MPLPLRTAVPAVAALLLALPAGAAAAPAGWGPPAVVAPAAAGVQPAGVATAPDGGALVVGTRRAFASEASELVALHRPPGGTWQARQVVAPGAADAGIRDADVAFAADGTATIAWVQETHPDTLWAATWTAGTVGTPVPVHVAATGDAVYGPELLVRPDGSQVLTWSGNRGVLAAVRSAAGTWGAPAAVSATGQDPAAAMDAAGDVVLTWSRPADTDMDGSPDAAQVQTATLPAGAGAFGATTDVTPAVAGVVDRDPAVGVAPGGRATFAFVRGDWDARTVLATVRPAGGTPAAPVALSTASPAQAPVVAAAAAGATVAFTQTGAGGRTAVLGAEVAADGSATAAAPLSGTGRRASAPQLTAGPGGSALLRWVTTGEDGSRALETLRRLPGEAAFESRRDVTAPDLEDPSAAALAADGAALQLVRGTWANAGAPLYGLDLPAAAPTAGGTAGDDDTVTPPKKGSVLRRVPLSCGGEMLEITDLDTGAVTMTAPRRRLTGAATGHAPAGDAAAHCAPPRSLTAPRISARFTRTRGGTRVDRVVVRRLLAGDVVRVRCAGRGCGKAPKAVRATGFSRTVRRPFRARLLRPGARVTVTVRRGATTVARARFTVRAGRAPRRA